MMEFAYRIRNWGEHFETSESRKIKGPLSWVALPTKHDGRGYKRATKHAHAVQAMCGWWSLLQVAAKMPVHGLLADRDGPLDAEDIADKTDLPKKIYVTTFDLMSSDKVGWLEKLPWDKNLDFAGNIAALVASQQLPASALEYQRGSAATSGKQRTKKETSSPGNASGQPRSSADSGSPQRIPADSSLHNSTRQDITFPLPSPKGGQGELQFDAAKQLLNEVFGREKRQWSREEDGLLADVVPIAAADAALIRRWFSLPEDHPVFQKTKRKHELTTYLRDFNGENDKMRRFSLLFMPVNGANGAKKDPPCWKETLRWIHGDQIHLPDRVDLLGSDLKKEYAGNVEAFQETLPRAVGEGA
jgi:hypothetical protein